MSGIVPLWTKLYVPTGDADPLIVELKFWHLPSSSLQWELRRFFVHTESERQSVQIGRLMKRELQPLRNLLNELFQEEQVFPPELQVLKSEKPEVTPNHRDQWAGTTWGFLAVMAYEGSSVRHRRKQHVPQLILETFLRKFIPEDRAIVLCELGTCDETHQLCQVRVRHQKCRHLPSITARLNSVAAEEPHVRLRHRLNTLAAAAIDCKSAAAWFGRLLQDCGEAIYSFTQENEFETDPLKSSSVTWLSSVWLLGLRTLFFCVWQQELL